MMELTGTEKQIEWAEKIRTRLFTGHLYVTDTDGEHVSGDRPIDVIINDRMVDEKNRLKKYEALEIGEKRTDRLESLAESTADTASLSNIVHKLSGIQSSKFWIDNRTLIWDIEYIDSIERLARLLK